MPIEVPIGRTATAILSATIVAAAAYPFCLWMLYPYGKAADALAVATSSERYFALGVSIALFAYMFRRLWRNRGSAPIPWHR
jgi:Na+-driven multidrug efflux pump